MEKVLSAAPKPLVLVVAAGALAVGLGSESYTTSEVPEGNLTTSLYPDAGSDGQAEMTNETAQCDSTFKANFFKIFFDEGCLAAMEPTESVACPVNEAEKFLDDVFGEFHVSSMCMAPFWLYLYMTVALLGNVPNPNVEGDGGRQRGQRVLYCLWVACQVGTALFQMLSLVWYILAYASMRGQMGACLTQVGSSKIVDLTIPLWALQIAVISRFAPLAVILAMFVIDWDDRQRRCEAVEGASDPFLLIELLSLLVVAFLAFWCLLLILGVVYCLATLGIAFSIVFIPISLCAAGALGIWALLAMALGLGFKTLLLSLRDNNIDLAWFLPAGEESDIKNVDCPLTVYCLLMGLMIMAPLVTFGSVLAFTVYGSGDGAQAIGWIYEYVFVTDFKLPSFVSMADLLEVFEDPTIIFELHKFMELPPHDVVLASVVSVGLGTTLSILRSIVFSLNTFLFTVTNGSCGYESRPLVKVRLGLAWKKEDQPEADKE